MVVYRIQPPLGASWAVRKLLLKAMLKKNMYSRSEEVGSPAEAEGGLGREVSTAGSRGESRSGRGAEEEWQRQARAVNDSFVDKLERRVALSSAPVRRHGQLAS